MAMKTTSITQKGTQPRRKVGLHSHAAHAASNDTANAAIDVETRSAELALAQANVALEPPTGATTPAGAIEYASPTLAETGIPSAPALPSE